VDTVQDYLKRLFQLTTWTEVIDEIYNEVEHIEPWMGGNARGPSTGFCLLFKLCQLKLTEQQIRNTLDHPDSPFIRAVRLHSLPSAPLSALRRPLIVDFRPCDPRVRLL